MQDALDSTDLVELGQHAHWFKGAGGTAGFAVFTEPAAEIERRAKRGDALAIDGLLQRIEVLISQIDLPPLPERMK